MPYQVLFYNRNQIHNPLFQLVILICLFYVVNEVFNGLVKKDNVSHVSHFIGAICGIVFIFYPI